MQELKDKFFYVVSVILIVLILLLSNLGQSFKNDIISSTNALDHINTFKSLWNNSRQYGDYINSSQNYITETLKTYNLQSLNESGFVEEWSNPMPTFKYPSSLEVLSNNKFGRIVKRYKYGEDFFEDFRGLIKSGIITDSAVHMSTINAKTQSLDKILLFDGYGSKSIEEIKTIDSELQKRGAKAVISPSFTSDIKRDSGLYESNFNPENTGLFKLIVSQDTFDELKRLADAGYTIKVKSGGEINPVKLKNVYAYIKGKNTSYKPLILVAFYDGLYNGAGYIDADFEKYTISSSLLLDIIRSVRYQRVRTPDRSIIFVFASGYMKNKEGIEKLFNKDINGDILILDGFGRTDSNFITASKNAKYLSDSIEYFLNKYNFQVLSKNILNGAENSFLYLTGVENGSDSVDIPRLFRSGKLLLSFIGDECYNLDFLSGNVAEFRIFKRFVKDYSAIISLFTIIFLIYIIFKRPSKRYR